MIAESNIIKLVEEAISGTDLFMVNCHIGAGNKIYVFLDGDSGVKIDDCVKVSRHIESNLDREKEDFELHVSSSGLDHPLRVLRQYQKNIGREISVQKNDGSNVSGVLKEVSAEKVVMEPKAKKASKKNTEPQETLVDIPFSEIKETKIIISFK